MQRVHCGERRSAPACRPTRESALAGVQYARSRIALLLAGGSSGGRAAAPDDDPGIGPSVGRRRRHQTDCAHRAGRWTRSPSSAGRTTSPRSRPATRFGMRRWDRPRGPRQVPRRAQTRLCGAVARRRFSLAVRGRGCGGHRRSAPGCGSENGRPSRPRALLGEPADQPTGEEPHDGHEQPDGDVKQVVIARRDHGRGDKRGP
jgi:hypothetical protein